ncbi:hypothetical protein [Yunchengibacter salinarum]|uniref:hypothetical protein n=1 Tax=Yunchengibacter salinarum TaxID=3133399 RepID=UPI0035B671B2
MNWKRYGAALVGAFVLYGLLYAIPQGLLSEYYDRMTTNLRAEGEPYAWLVMPGHMVQTVAIVTIFFLFVKTRHYGHGALYGLMTGLLFLGNDLVMLGSLDIVPPGLIVSMAPMHLVFGVLVALFITFLYRPKGEG